MSTDMKTRYEELCIDFDTVTPNEIWKFVQLEFNLGSENLKPVTSISTTTQKNKDNTSN